jgi:6-pyruvoyltetrahydropterin/6-carboxytetrahydropterin synthase
MGHPVMFELSKQFRFEAAHTLDRLVDAEPSRRIHGHSYRAEVFIRGLPDPKSGMVTDLGLLEHALAHARDGLDHRFFNELNGLGPATMENLAVWIWRRVAPNCRNLAKVTVYRDSSGDACSYFGSHGQGAAA